MAISSVVQFAALSWATLSTSSSFQFKGEGMTYLETAVVMAEWMRPIAEAIMAML